MLKLIITTLSCRSDMDPPLDSEHRMKVLILNLHSSLHSIPDGICLIVGCENLYLDHFCVNEFPLVSILDVGLGFYSVVILLIPGTKQKV